MEMVEDVSDLYRKRIKVIEGPIRNSQNFKQFIRDFSGNHVIILKNCGKPQQIHSPPATQRKNRKSFAILWNSNEK